MLRRKQLQGQAPLALRPIAAGLGQPGECLRSIVACLLSLGQPIEQRSRSYECYQTLSVVNHVFQLLSPALVKGGWFSPSLNDDQTVGLVGNVEAFP
jgi:hypothetical protein